MKFFHGTASRHLRSILSDGLNARNQTQVSNWEHSIPSNDNTVYLTNAYALYFAAQAAEHESDKLAVLEIDGDVLYESELCADEDAVEQTTRGKDDLPRDWSIEQRTLYYRELAYAYHWDQSLKALGTCGYLDVIPPEAITRVALVEVKTYTRMVWAGYDPSIGILNYRICGGKYRFATRWLFDPETKREDEKDDPFALLGLMDVEVDRTGIEVLKLDEAKSRFCAA